MTYLLLGLVAGTLSGLIGARFATGLSNVVLEKIFGISLLLIAVKMIFFK